MPGTAQSQKIGILTFEDASGAGPQLGEQVAKYIRSDLLKEKRFMPKFIKYTPGENESQSVDLEKAIAIGKKEGCEYVVIGTILEAESDVSKTGIGGVQVLGQRVGSSLNTVTASITIQADLISIKDEKLIESFRTSGSDTNSAVGADVSTHWGSFDADRDGTKDNPISKALREAVEDLVKELSAKI
jgi:curli biogenesis system outer membrane secretion channel CsgG